MNCMRHLGVPLFLIALFLISPGTALPQPSTPLHSFTAQYQLKRGKMIIGKVTTTLQLEPNGNYTYRSVTMPVGLMAVFSKDEITEISKGRIDGHSVIPSSYSYRHKRKKRPKLRRLQFNWPANRVTAPGTKPQWSSAITPGTQDKASKILAMMLSMNRSPTDLEIRVADKTKLKSYRISRVKQEQLVVGDASYHTIELHQAKAGQPVSTRFWLAPKLNYLPVKVARKEKKHTFTMTLVKFSLGQPAPGSTN